jgi:hypothetical protein
VSIDLKGYVRARKAHLREQIDIVAADRDVKLELNDHHGVRDACVDIETKEARIAELDYLLDQAAQVPE